MPTIFLGLVLLGLAGCATTRATTWDYRFQRPVIGTAGTVLPITDTDWNACDLEADREAWAEASYMETSSDGVLISTGSGVWPAYYLVPRRYGELEPEPVTAKREQDYERLMRACLVNRGYAIGVPPAPNRAFGAKP
jgi:hypothetical protein